MSIGYNPKIVTKNLVGYWDAGNSLKSAKGFKNMLDLSTWTLGTGGTSNFFINGTTAENQRILDTGPFGVSTMVWDEPSNDVTSDADGGWNTASVTIDPTKMYRFSVWMRRKVIGNGYYYLGCYGLNASGVNEGVLNRWDGVTSTNPYFSTGVWPSSNITTDAWMLVVGHVWPAGSGTGSNHIDSGLYNTSGTKFSNITNGDFVWQSTNTYTINRSYLYYSTDTTTNQQWYQPRIDLVDGTQPSIADLIAGVGSKWYDISGNNNHGTILNSAALYNSSGYMNFDGVDDGVTATHTSPTTITLSVWWQAASTGAYQYILDTNTDNSSYGFTIQINPGLTGFYTTLGGVIFDNLVSYTFTSGNWYNIVVTFDGTTVIRYINGVQVASTGGYFDSSIIYSSSNFRIGLSSTGIYPTKGKIPIVKIYNRALSVAEVKQNFNATRGRFGLQWG